MGTSSTVTGLPSGPGTIWSNVPKSLMSSSNDDPKPPKPHNTHTGGGACCTGRSVRSRSTFSILVQTQLRLRKFAVTSKLYELKMRRAPFLRSLFLPQMKLDDTWPERNSRLWWSDALVRTVSSVGSEASGLLIRPVEN